LFVAMNTFPNDENGAVLQRMREQGDDLSKARDIDFTVVFPSEEASRMFVEATSQLGYSASAELTECVLGFPWEVTVVRHMVPTHAAIGEFESQLEREAQALGGCNDGWGCFQQ
jgi:hypothetical protein